MADSADHPTSPRRVVTLTPDAVSALVKSTLQHGLMPVDMTVEEEEAGVGTVEDSAAVSSESMPPSQLSACDMLLANTKSSALSQLEADGVVAINVETGSTVELIGDGTIPSVPLTTSGASMEMSITAADYCVTTPTPSQPLDPATSSSVTAVTSALLALASAKPYPPSPATQPSPQPPQSSTAPANIAPSTSIQESLSAESLQLSTTYSNPPPPSIQPRPLSSRPAAQAPPTPPPAHIETQPLPLATETQPTSTITETPSTSAETVSIAPDLSNLLLLQLLQRNFPALKLDSLNDMFNLQTNFPSLKLDNLKEIFQVNALLKQSLQQQQQQKQQLLKHQEQLQQLKQQQQQPGSNLSTQTASSSGVSSTNGSGGVGVVSTSPAVATRVGAVVSSTGNLSSGLRVGTPAIKSPAVKAGGGRLAATLMGSAGLAGSTSGTVQVQGSGSGRGRASLGAVKLTSGGIANVGVNLGGGGLPTATSVGVASSGLSGRGRLINSLASKLGKANSSPGKIVLSPAGKTNPGAKGLSGKVISPSLGVRGAGGKIISPSLGIRGPTGKAISTALGAKGVTVPPPSVLGPKGVVRGAVGVPISTTTVKPSTQVLAISTATSSGMSSTTDGGDASMSRTPVFAQILANMRKQQSLLSSTALAIEGAGTGNSLLRQPGPLLLGKPGDHASLMATIPKGPSPLHSASKAMPFGVAPKMSSRTAAKNSQPTLVEREGVESMDVDVGKPFQMMELPPHLKEHDYSLYNLEEGEKLAKGRNLRITSNIPPSRVSYAPKVREVYCETCEKWDLWEFEGGGEGKEPVREGGGRGSEGGEGRGRSRKWGGGGGGGGGAGRGGGKEEGGEGGREVRGRSREGGGGRSREGGGAERGERECGRLQNLWKGDIRSVCTMCLTVLPDAPLQVPDSPSTLYKLLKVLPRKNSRRSSVSGSSRTSGVSKAKKMSTASSKKG